MGKNDFVISSGNLFADMELDDAEGVMARAQLGHIVRKLLEERRLEQWGGISELLGVDQAEVSKLMDGKYYLFSEERLLDFLNRLDCVERELRTA